MSDIKILGQAVLKLTASQQFCCAKLHTLKKDFLISVVLRQSRPELLLAMIYSHAMSLTYTEVVGAAA
jgi:hypothetical protein